MKSCTDVEEARKVCMNRTKRRTLLTAYPFTYVRNDIVRNTESIVNVKKYVFQTYEYLNNP